MFPCCCLVHRNADSLQVFFFLFLRVWPPSRTRFAACPWRKTWQKNAIRQASKDTQRLPPPNKPHPLALVPVWLPSCITWARRRHASKAGWSGYICKRFPGGAVKLPPFGWSVSGQGALLPRQPHQRGCNPLILLTSSSLGLLASLRVPSVPGRNPGWSSRSPG